MAIAVNLDLSTELVEALDREVEAGSYANRGELVQRAIERLLESPEIHPAEEWTGRAGLRLLGEAAERLPYEAEESTTESWTA